MKRSTTTLLLCELNCVVASINFACFWLLTGDWRWINFSAGLFGVWVSASSLNIARRIRHAEKLLEESNFHLAKMREGIDLGLKAQYLFHQEQEQAVLERIRQIVEPKSK